MPTKIKFNAISMAGGHILYEDANEIHLPVVVMKEGLIHGSAGYDGPALRRFESFKDDIKGLEGTHILRGHSQVNAGRIVKRADSIGHIKQVRANAGRRNVTATAVFDKSKLTPQELAEIRSPEAFDASIEFSCSTVRKNGVYGGRSYEWEELGPFRYYGVAKLPAGSGACSVFDGCGFKMNKKFSRSNNMSDIKVNSRARRTPDGIEVEFSLDDEMEAGLRQFEDAYAEDQRAKLNAAKDALAATQQWIAKNPIDRSPKPAIQANTSNGMSAAEVRARQEAQESRLSQTVRQNTATPATIVIDSYPSEGSDLSERRRIKIALEKAGVPLTSAQQAVLDKYDLGDSDIEDEGNNLVEKAKQQVHETLRNKSASSALAGRKVQADRDAKIQAYTARGF